MAVAATLIEKAAGLLSYFGLFTINFASTLTLVESASQDLTFPGAVIGDLVFIQPTVRVANQQFWGYVSAADVVTVGYQNVTAATVDPASQVFKVWVVKTIPANVPA